MARFPVFHSSSTTQPSGQQRPTLRSTVHMSHSPTTPMPAGALHTQPATTRCANNGTRSAKGATETVVSAAAAGNLACLVRLHEGECPLDAEAMDAALNPKGFTHSQSERGEAHMACLRYLIAHGCPWSDRTCTLAVRRGSAWLALVLESGCPFDPKSADVDNAARTILESGDAASVPLLATRGYRWEPWHVRKAVREYDTDMVEALLDAGVPWDPEMAAYMAWMDDTDSLERIIARGLAWDVQECMLEAVSSPLGGDAWFMASERACPRLAKFCLRAVERHQTFALCRLLANGFPWDPVAGAKALVESRDAESLAAVTRAGLVGAGPCAHSADLCAMAAFGGHDDVVKILAANGHRGDARTAAEAARRGNTALLKWIIDQGWPVDHDGGLAKAAV
ncbi:hypothetical protein psal_cds_70 [Pandoravirus salinus]|uniref:Ankyrin repeat domain containing protein n=1 Tax=Pandoravirus salinus TaxID=1349410 RepID=S4VT74_9VIRU|nr:hypothetical protein psal_cds_70 [Pandoravirus salinus]AGO83478.1 hypothetical protein psal_cds_70 [Pandoravirus salinus]